MIYRPRRPKPDANQAEIVRDLRDDGYGFVVTASLPGDPIDNPLDGFVLRPGAPVIVACSAAGVRRYFEAHPDVLIVQVEIKVSPGAPFTKNEKKYLERRGWDGRVWL